MTAPGEVGPAAMLQLAALAGRVDDIDGQLRELSGQVAGLGAGVEEDDDSRGYQPAPSPRWWLIRDEERDEAVTRLRGWVDQVFRPSYRHLAGRLPACWDQHDLCLFALDWLSELWSVLYLQPRRSAGALAGQGEWQVRLLPAAVEQMTREAAGCGHSRQVAGVNGAVR